MAIRSKVPSWIQRRCNGRPVARWIAWNTNRSASAESQVEARREAVPVERVDVDNVVYLFRRFA